MVSRSTGASAPGNFLDDGLDSRMTAGRARPITTSPDAWFVGALLLAALLVALPMTGGGLALYLDNPPHLAEIHAAAAGPWSDDAWCGFPVRSLHSPLWYTPLVWIEKAGGPTDLVYFGAVLLGFLAPALAMYRVARRSLAPPVAVLPAFFLLIQRPAIVGVGSAFGGMWTFYLAAGFFILLVDELARGRTLWRPAAMTGLVLLTHLFPLAPVALVGGAALLLGVSGGRLKVTQAVFLSGALMLGVLAAAVYWLPLLRAGELTRLAPQTLAPGQIIARLLWPTDILAMLTGRLPGMSPATVAGALPMVLLTMAGLGGALLIKRRRDDGPLLGLVLTVFVLVMLLVVVGQVEVKFLGPVTWRLLYFARLGLAFMALPLLALAPVIRPRLQGLLMTLLLAGAFFSGRPLASQSPNPDSPDMADIRRTWAWLAANGQPEWGRVHLQDTFTLEPGPQGLGASHVLALTARETGVRQVGAAYSVAPFATVPWTSSEFSMLFGRFIRQPSEVSYVADMARFANATHILTSDPRTAVLLKASGAFTSLFVAGRFEILELQGYTGAWARGLDNGKPRPDVDFRPGKISVPLAGGDQAHGILVKAAYHPNWRLADPDRAELSAHPSGLIQVTEIQPGLSPLELEFKPSPWPLYLSLLAILGMAGLRWVNPRPT